MKRLALAVVLGLSASAVAADESLSGLEGAMALDLPEAAAPVDADTRPAGKDRTGLSLRATASSLGLGGEAAWRLNDRFGLRAPFGSAEMDFDGAFEGYDIKGTVKTGGVGLMLDYFPMGGAFHVSGGAFHTDYGASGIARDVEVDGYTTDVSMEFQQKQSFAPVAALGWDWQIGKHGLVTADLGAIFGSGFDVEARESSGYVSQERVDAEIADVRDAAGKMKVIPYLKLGVGIKF